ncbi:MAG: peptidase domain-containing ABC transporter [Gallionella sp.]|jgi:ATP-binding cassette subfamily B protein RaxB
MADGSIFSAWANRRQLPLVMQTEAAECALACLAMIARYHGHDIDLASLRRRFSTSLKGVDLNRVIEIAHGLGFEARPLRAELGYLPEAQLPCILHWNLNHFVVLNQVTRRGADIYDPARGQYCMPLAEASKHFTGVVLELTPGTDFTPVEERQRISLRALTGRITGLTRVLTQVIGLAFAIEVLALVMPFQMQLILDQVLVSADKSLLAVLTVGFLIVMGLSAALNLARAWVISWLGASLNAQWVTNLFSHLLKLPLDYFEKRHMGDILSRFSSVQSIQNTITGSFVEALLDGLMGSLTLIILCLYSLPLTLVVLVALSLYSLLRWAMYLTLWRINEEQLIYGARQQSELMESVRGVQAIKLANKQSERKVRLANATLEAAKRTMRSQRITLAFGVINQSLFGAQRIALIAMGAYLAIQGKFSAGMLVAYVVYADQFATKIGSLVDKVVDFRMLRLHAERIADIALASPEKHAKGVYSGPEPEPCIEVKNLSFRYADGEPWVLRHLSLTILPGESVAIVGPSGYGKSTLAKLLVGLLEPTEGNIEIGGIDIRKYGLENYRKLIGAVMQDDTLFAGSIADNITLFDSTVVMNDIISAATMAEIHQEIMSMPMAYESTVGDMGSALSGGQKQRMLFARALLKNPKILVLDEATSHLDARNEALINKRVKGLDLTRIIIAHRAETIANAQTVLDLTKLNLARNLVAE